MDITKSRGSVTPVIVAAVLATALGATLADAADTDYRRAIPPYRWRRSER